MYRDDTCAVCGESLPPDHFYCREHGVTVDDRLHRIGALLERLVEDAPRLGELTGQVAQETWDYLAEAEPDEPDWPPEIALSLKAHPDDVDVDVDTEPGRVEVRVTVPLPSLAAAIAQAVASPSMRRLAAAAANAEGANATH